MTVTRNQRIIAIILVISVSVSFLLAPSVVEARGFFKNLLRFIGRTTKFIIRLPGNIASTVTRPLGPVLGPIAAQILLANTPNKILEVVTKADKVATGVDLIQAQEAKLAAAQEALREQAGAIEKEIDGLYSVKAQLEQQLLSGDISYDEYKEQFIAFNDVLGAYQETQTRLEQAAQNLKPQNLVRLIGGDILKVTAGQIGNIVQQKIGEELQRIISQDVINKFLGDNGMNVVNVIDLVMTGDITRLLNEQGYDRSDPNFDALLAEIKAEIKAQLEDNKDYVRDNWETLLDEKIKEIVENQQTMTNSMLTNTGTTTNTNVDTDNSDSYIDPSMIPLDEDGCKPGWEWDIKIGKCIQSNCADVSNAHYSYVLDCVCGSSGSVAENPDDPNKECSYPLNYGPCSGCVYSCVELDADCPDLP